ncbi:MAG: SIS domain-containing protein [Oscillospiraceae bacterium]|jgi:D-sedoheptulose 7-phosphate isomerase|nr:SIS domain-containing protein [Oscillospiraceae bacterium]
MRLATKEIFGSLFERYPTLISIKEKIHSAFNKLVNCYEKDGKVLICGNGGSSADSLHIVGELMKSFNLPRKLTEDERVFSDYLNENLQRTLPAISLVNNVSLITAYINDADSELIFAQQVFGYGKNVDVLIAISTTGNSANILYAAEVAKAKGLKVISLTGLCGGKLAPLSDIVINVPETETYKIQELHVPIYHALCLALEEHFFGEVKPK